MKTKILRPELTFLVDNPKIRAKTLISRGLLEMPTTVLSDEQLAIARHVDKGNGHFIVRARAGTGKTFLILQCLPLMRGSISIMAYGNAIAAEIRSKVAKTEIRGIDVMTFHSLGARILNKVFPNSKLEGIGKGKAGAYKFPMIAEKLEIPKYLHAFVKKTMSMAMLHGFGVAGLESAKDQAAWQHLVSYYGIDAEIADDNVLSQLQSREVMILEGLRYAYQALNLSKKMADTIYTYDEMLWLPLLLNAKFPTFDWVIVDEAQDTNPVRREMAMRMMHQKTRSFWCGDDKQSIFAFTGASVDSLDVIERKLGAKIFPMTQTFRCGKKIVELAQQIVPDYRAAPGNHEGEVTNISEADFHKLTLVPGQDAIICRNTKPLIPIAYNLIKHGIKAHIEGRDIGAGLLALVNRWQGVKTIPALMARLNEWQTKEVAKLMAAKQEMQADAVADKVDTIQAFVDGLPKDATLADLRQKIEAMFADTKDGDQPPSVPLMTAHRSKGREYHTVYGWGVATLMPSKRAKKPHELVQEENLEYVLKTRAIHKFVDVQIEG